MPEPTTGDKLLALIFAEATGEHAVRFEGGQTVPLSSLAPGEFAAIQRDLGETWTQILRSPLRRLDVAERVVAACARKVGRAVPGELGGEPWADVTQLVRMFVVIPSTVPDLPDVPSEGDESPPT